MLGTVRREGPQRIPYQGLGSPSCRIQRVQRDTEGRHGMSGKDGCTRSGADSPRVRGTRGH